MKARLTQLLMGLTAAVSATQVMAHGDHPTLAGVSHGLLHAIGGWDNLLAAAVLVVSAGIALRILRQRR